MKLSEQYDHLEKYKKVAVALIGVIFLLILAASVFKDMMEEHEHGLMGMTHYMILFLFGIFLIFPKLGLELLEALPLPPFLRRDRPPDKPSPPDDHSDSEHDEDHP